jgi:hypothetical protein
MTDTWRLSAVAIARRWSSLEHDLVGLLRPLDGLVELVRLQQRRVYSQ